MNILAFTRYSLLGASTRLRFISYIPYLQLKDKKVELEALISDEMLKTKYKNNKYNIVKIFVNYYKRIIRLITVKNEILWIEKELFPWFPFWFEFLFLKNKKYVLEYDDAIFHLYDDHKNLIVRFLYKNKIKKLAQRANKCVVGNDYLAKYCFESGCISVIYIPTIIDLSRYSAIKNRSNTQILSIIWIGTNATVKYLEVIEKPLLRLSEEKKIKLIIVGANKSIFDHLKIEVEYIDWELERENELILNGDIGVMPLIDTPWEWGKCGYKLLQYMACGLPVVGTPIGVNRTIIEDGINGYWASSKEDWYVALKKLIECDEQRITMGRAGLIKVKKEYNLEDYRPIYNGIFDSINA